MDDEPDLNSLSRWMEGHFEAVGIALWVAIETGSKEGSLDLGNVEASLRSALADSERLHDALGANRRRVKPVEWALSRTALLKAMVRARMRAKGPLTWSLSHTPWAGLAVVVESESSRAAGIGADVERAERPLSMRALRRIRNPLDRLGGISPIAQWTAKEAVFKASGHPHFAEICLEIEELEPEGALGTATTPDQQLQLAVGTAHGYMVAIAACLSPR